MASVGYLVGDATGSGKPDSLVTSQGKACGSGEREGNVSVYAGVSGNTLGAEALTLDQYAFDLESPTDPWMQLIPNVVGRIFGCTSTM